MRRQFTPDIHRNRSRTGTHRASLLRYRCKHLCKYQQIRTHGLHFAITGLSSSDRVTGTPLKRRLERMLSRPRFPSPGFLYPPCRQFEACPCPLASPSSCGLDVAHPPENQMGSSQFHLEFMNWTKYYRINKENFAILESQLQLWLS